MLTLREVIWKLRTDDVVKFPKVDDIVVRYANLVDAHWVIEVMIGGISDNHAFRRLRIDANTGEIVKVCRDCYPDAESIMRAVCVIFPNHKLVASRIQQGSGADNIFIVSIKMPDEAVWTLTFDARSNEIARSVERPEKEVKPGIIFRFLNWIF